MKSSNRQTVAELTDLPNIGIAVAGDLRAFAQVVRGVVGAEPELGTRRGADIEGVVPVGWRVQIAIDALAIVIAPVARRI